MLLAPEEGAGIGVYVEDVDSPVTLEGEDGEDMDWSYGMDNPTRTNFKPPVTARPPMPGQWASS